MTLCTKLSRKKPVARPSERGLSVVPSSPVSAGGIATEAETQKTKQTNQIKNKKSSSTYFLDLNYSNQFANVHPHPHQAGGHRIRMADNWGWAEWEHISKTKYDSASLDSANLPSFLLLWTSVIIAIVVLQFCGRRTWL